MSDPYRFTFLLPQAMLLLVPDGQHNSRHDDSVVTAVDHGRVTNTGPSRPQIFEQVRRMFRAHARRMPAFEVAAIMQTPQARGGGRDSYTIAVNSDITIAPTGLGVELGAPPLTIISAG